MRFRSDQLTILPHPVLPCYFPNWPYIQGNSISKYYIIKGSFYHQCCKTKNQKWIYIVHLGAKFLFEWTPASAGEEAFFLLLHLKPTIMFETGKLHSIVHLVWKQDALGDSLWNTVLEMRTSKWQVKSRNERLFSNYHWRTQNKGLRMLDAFESLSRHKVTHESRLERPASCYSVLVQITSSTAWYLKHPFGWECPTPVVYLTRVHSWHVQLWAVTRLNAAWQCMWSRVRGSILETIQEVKRHSSITIRHEAVWKLMIISCQLFNLFCMDHTNHWLNSSIASHALYRSSLPIYLFITNQSITGYCTILWKQLASTRRMKICPLPQAGLSLKVTYILWAYLQPKVSFEGWFPFYFIKPVLRFIETERVTQEEEKERRKEKRGRKGTEE